MIRRALSLASFALFAFAVAPAAAQTATTTFEVSIEIANSCTVLVDDMPFGPVTTLASPVDASADGTVTCTSVAPVEVSFNAGTGGGTLAARLMTDGTNTIEYNLYRDPARTEVLGDETGGTFAVEVPATGAPDPFTIYGRTSAPQGAKPVGTYLSTVTATVTF